eukprot:1182082-Rhodomonas_salina.1
MRCPALTQRVAVPDDRGGGASVAPGLICPLSAYAYACVPAYAYACLPAYICLPTPLLAYLPTTMCRTLAYAKRTAVWR